MNFFKQIMNLMPLQSYDYIGFSIFLLHITSSFSITTYTNYQQEQ